MFASEEKAARHAPTSREIEEPQQIAMPQTKSEAAADAREDGMLHAGRIWVRPQEMDDTTDWSDEAATEAELDAEASHLEDADDVAPADNLPRDSEPELVPVAASVFDDDFFRAASARSRSAGKDEVHGSTAVAQGASASAGVEEPARDVRLFAGASGSSADHADSDELDIPAFLRRSH
jgi:hypothetical protein